jgi:uncharacterized protein DUF5990
MKIQGLTPILNVSKIGDTFDWFKKLGWETLWDWYRFFYINIGTYAGQLNTEWSRRLKVPLSVIDWDVIRTQKVLVASIPGTDKDGGPSCAYEWRKRVSPSWQWQLED